MHPYRVLPAIFLIVLAGCSTAPTVKKEEPAPEPVTGLHALAQMFSAARTWQPDVMVLRETSLSVGDLKPQPGRSAAWQAVFVSLSARLSRTYTFSVMDIGTSVRQGSFADTPASFSASGQNAQAFIIAAAKRDTDEAFATASEHAKDYAAKHPGLPVNYLLELNNRWPDATWRVFWGESASNAGFAVLVDATTGKFARVLD